MFPFYITKVFLISLPSLCFLICYLLLESIKSNNHLTASRAFACTKHWQQCLSQNESDDIWDLLRIKYIYALYWKCWGDKIRICNCLLPRSHMHMQKEPPIYLSWESNHSGFTSCIIEPDMLIFYPFHCIIFVSSDPSEKKINPYFYLMLLSPFSFLSLSPSSLPCLPLTEWHYIFVCINCLVKCTPSHYNSPFKTIILSHYVFALYLFKCGSSELAHF